MTRTALIVLSYNGAPDTIDCLDSIYRSKPAESDVIVIDNASKPGTVAALRTAHPETEIVELAENGGWAGGNNAGIRLALERGYELICLMNNDLVVKDGALARLIEASEAVGPCLMHPKIAYYDDVDRMQLDLSSDEPMRGHPNIRPMTWAYGACLLIHAEIFKIVGLIDERYFLQMEETDFYLRSVKAGYLANFCANSCVIHKESASMGELMPPMKVYYIVRNHLLLAETHSSNVKEYIKYIRNLMWTIVNFYKTSNSDIGLFTWILSKELRARAIRRGISDYLARRFGKMSQKSQRLLKVAS